jgi:hypothetical protein
MYTAMSRNWWLVALRGAIALIVTCRNVRSVELAITSSRRPLTRDSIQFGTMTDSMRHLMAGFIRCIEQLVT